MPIQALFSLHCATPNPRYILLGAKSEVTDPAPQQEKRRPHGRLFPWRRGRDSNPRNLAAHRFSRAANSTTLAPLHSIAINKCEIAHSTIVSEVYTKSMSNHTAAIRVITAVYFKRLLLYGLGFLAIFTVVIISLTTLLATQISVWWWLLLIIFLPPIIILSIIAAVLWILSSRLLPRKLSRRETIRVRHFTATLFGLMETAHTPYPLLLVIIGKDILQGRPNAFLKETIMNSRTLKTDYNEITGLLE